MGLAKPSASRLTGALQKALPYDSRKNIIGLGGQRQLEFLCRGFDGGATKQRADFRVDG